MRPPFDRQLDAKEDDMFHRVNRMRYRACSERSNPLYAKKLQDLRLLSLGIYSL
jgi:hypothetical protein